MGTWGTAISSNDTYADVFGEFFDLYDDGANVSEISTKLISKNHETINDPDDATNFWFALAKAQWDCKELDPELLKKVEMIVQSGADVEAWRRMDASEKDLRKRGVVLLSFLEKLRSEKTKVRARKTKIVRQPIFEKGDCLTFRLESGNYGGAVVLEASANVGFGLNLVAATRINQVTKPTIADFRKAEILVINYATWEDKPSIGWNYSLRFKKHRDLFEAVGRIDIIQQFDPYDHTSRYHYGYRGDWKVWIIDVTNLQFNSEREKAKPKKSVTVKEFMKRRWFR